MIKIRKANIHDSPSIVAFQLKMALETEDLLLNKPTVEEGVKAVFADENKGSYYVAEIEENVVASLMTTYEWSDWRNGRVLWIQSVFVDKMHRGKGIYRKLYEHIREIVKNDDTDFRGIRLYVDKTNLSAQKVYAKMGMENHHYEMYEWMNDY